MNIEQISFGIISFAGDSFYQMKEAIQSAKKKDFDKANEFMAEAKKLLREAHDIHTKIIVGEAGGEKAEYSVLLSHAQDTMMNAVLFETIAEELIDVYKTR
ncbi:PTS lactose/cellobiose transporter subunit IIA [Clostridium paraputrificum]|uniref:PTS lactose/cellobiose transporter subunit IIA n=1 Tax=Clostridium TaxID=1485 RepID=UPI003D339AAD